MKRNGAQELFFARPWIALLYKEARVHLAQLQRELCAFMHFGAIFDLHLKPGGTLMKRVTSTLTGWLGSSEQKQVAILITDLRRGLQVLLVHRNRCRHVLNLGAEP